MAVYKPKYRDPKTGESKQSTIWWYNFVFAGKRVRESSKSTRKTIAVEAEKTRRLQLERAYAGMPTGGAADRIASVSERVRVYLHNYPSRAVRSKCR